MATVTAKRRRNRRRIFALSGSPVLIGAVTVLVTITAVYIAYTANDGLPFVPSYELRAELPSGSKLTKGNDVRIGGFRVGLVTDIAPKVVERGGRRRAIALITMKLDKSVQPLPRDTRVLVRQRSALGLKYVELTPGRSRAAFPPGATIPLAQARAPAEIEDLFATFDDRTRPAIQDSLDTFGDAFAGRGSSLNDTIAALPPLLRRLEPVARNLADPATGLPRFIQALRAFTGELAPAAREFARSFRDMATTFEAIAADPGALQRTIERSPATLDASISSFRAQRPLYADLDDLSARLRPALREARFSLPVVDTALLAGTDVLPRTVDLSRRTRSALAAATFLFTEPDTLQALRDVRAALTVTRPAAEFIAPYQTVCNYAIYFLHPLGEHQSGLSVDGAGTNQAQLLKLPNLLQPNNYGTSESSRPVDVPPGVKARGARDASGMPLHRLIAPPYSPAIDAQGNADCQRGQEGYPNGPLTPPGSRYGPGALPDGTPTGANAAVGINDYPILSGGTFVTRRLGITNLRDIP